MNIYRIPTLSEALADDESESQRAHRQSEDLAAEVLSIAKAQILVKLRFLDRAMFELKPLATEDYPLASDGVHLLYQPMYLLRSYRQSQAFALRVWAHILMHCLFRHMFIPVGMKAEYWDLAADIASEGMVRELQLPQLQDAPGQRERNEILDALQKDIRTLTAEKLLRYFQQTNVDESTLQRWRNLFTVDDHSLWYEPPQAGSSPQPSPSGSDGESEDDENSSNSSEESPEGSQESDEEKDQGQGQDGGASSLPGNKQDSEQGNQAENEPGDSPGNDPSQASQQLQDDRYDYPQLRELESMWRDISEHVQTDLETFSKQHGFSPSRMTQALHALNREKADYTAFLRKFATMHEVMRLSPDEFDYIFYTYGLEMYHDMPLIEPLEYREDKRIRDFVIAIDTSGSVRGALVQNFLQKTYTILKQEETFDRKFNLHIIQCDADIQEDALITTQEEFDEYISHLRLHGFGGTDFRPVFEYVEQLRRTHAFQDLRGLLYFTDGYGTYPSHQTDYTTAFVFLDDDDDGQHLVPPWAVRVILETPDLEDTKR